MLIYNELMWLFLHLQIILGNYLRFLGVTVRHVLAKQPQEGVPWKKLIQNFDKKGDGW